MVRATNDIVLGVALGALVPELFGHVGEELPPREEWEAPAAFIRYAVVGGTPDVDLTLRRPVYTLEAWSNNGDDVRPPWGYANLAIEYVRELSERFSSNAVLGNVRCVPPDPWEPFVVHNLLIHQEPRKFRGDQTGAARYDMDIELWWTPLPAEVTP